MDFKIVSKMMSLYFLQPRKRNNKKLSHAAQIAQTMEGCIDLETPDSILVNTNLKVCSGCCSVCYLFIFCSSLKVILGSLLLLYTEPRNSIESINFC